MKINKEHKIEIDLQELADSLTDEDRKLFFQSVVFQEQLLTAAVETVATGSCFDECWYVGGLADSLRVKLLAVVAEGMQELVHNLLRERDTAKEEARATRALLFRLERHWPQDVKPNLCRSESPEYCTCSWTQEQVEEFLTEKLGANWKSELESEQTKAT